MTLPHGAGPQWVAAPAPTSSRPLAGAARRGWAYLADGAALVLLSRLLLPGWHARVQAELLGLVQLGVASGQGMPGPGELWARGTVQLWLLGSIIALGLSVAWDLGWLAFAGATPGQLLCGIRLVPQGQPGWPGRLPLPMAWRRTVCRRLLTSFVKPLFWISSTLLTQEGARQDWPDQYARTQVVHRV